MAKITKIEGKPVKDAKRALTVVITHADVKQGAKKNQHSCAAAVSLCRQFEAAQVHVTRTYVKKNGKWYRYYTPAALRSEIVSFDRGGKFEPGVYTLAKCYAPQTQGARATRAYSKSGKPGKNKRKPHVTTGIRPHFA